VFIGLFTFGSLLVFPTSHATPVQPFLETLELNGPMINEVIFSVYHGGGAQWAAMVDGLIDIGNAPIAPQERTGIEVNAWEADAFWAIACSTHYDAFFIEEPYGLPAVNGFPFNYLAMRRAVAMALDKYDIAQDSFGEAGIALDHVIPASFAPWHESDLSNDYRRGNINGAIDILENAGFTDFNGDGQRDAPNATEVNLTLYYFPMGLASKATSHSKIATNTTRLAEIIGTTMEALGFRIDVIPVSEQTLWDYTHVGYRSYQMALIPVEVPERAPSLLEELFYSFNIPTSNIMNFHNTTVDTIIETLNVTTDYYDYQNLLSQLQLAIAENQPLIPLCTTTQYTAQRIDRFEDWYNQPGKGAANTWSLLHARLRTGQPDLHPISGVGGTMQFGLHSVPDSLNPVLAVLPESFLVLDSMYSRLVRMDPNTGEALPDLAHAWRIEPEGNGLRFTFFLHDNATWHDGEIFAADDVAFTYDYVNNLPGPWPYLRPKPHIEYSSIDVIDNETLVIHTPLNGYFAIFDIASTLILPQHLWEGILQPAHFSNPRPVGTGPFRFDKQPEPGLIYLEYFPKYHYGLIGSRDVAGYVDVSFLIWLSGGIFLIAITVVGAYWFLRPRPHGFES
jgi:ABC-type transport system substrate-binding protein